jgi:hypothetical protein
VSNAQQARRLENLLEQRAAKRLAVTWDQAPDRGGWRWCVDWSDGPTVEQMRAWVQEIAADVAPLEIASLDFCRRYSLIAWSVQLVRYVAGGGALQDRYAARYLIEDAMQRTDAPDHPVDELEARRAKALRRLVMHQVAVNGENAVTVGDEVEMVEALSACGLEVLDLDGALDDLRSD